jgi:hypothetical protein
MGLFGRKKKIEEEDLRTDLEKKFEHTGQVAGKKTGEFVQGSINKIEKVKEKVKADEKIEKVKVFASKAEEKIEEVVVKAKNSTKQTYGKVKQKVSKQ